MKDLCIVTCGKKKIWDINPNTGPKEAKEVYIGPLSKKAKEYAEKYHPKSWMILSAKYGFIYPDEIIPKNYDVCFHDKKSKTISLDKLKMQADKKNFDEYDSITVLGGKFYTKLIIDLFPNKKIINPLDGCKGIGYMLKKINDSIKDNKKL